MEGGGVERGDAWCGYRATGVAAANRWSGCLQTGVEDGYALPRSADVVGETRSVLKRGGATASSGGVTIRCVLGAVPHSSAYIDTSWQRWLGTLYVVAASVVLCEYQHQEMPVWLLRFRVALCWTFSVPLLWGWEGPVLPSVLRDQALRWSACWGIVCSRSQQNFDLPRVAWAVFASCSPRVVSCFHTDVS